MTLVGCGGGLTGDYHAEVEEMTPNVSRPKGYSLEEVRAKLAAEPEQIELKSGGRFVLRRKGATVWDGKWRVEGEQLLLRAEVVNGTAVLPQLQDDKRYKLQSGALVDEGRYGAYGLRLVYRKK